AANTNAPENPTCTEIATAAPDAATHPRKDARRDTLGTSRATSTALTIATSNSTPNGSATVNGIGKSLATEYAAHGRASRVGTAAMATRTLDNQAGASSMGASGRLGCPGAGGVGASPVGAGSPVLPGACASSVGAVLLRAVRLRITNRPCARSARP